MFAVVVSHPSKAPKGWGSFGGDSRRAPTRPTRILPALTLMDDPRWRIWRNGRRYTHAGRSDGFSKSSAALSKDERILADISAQGLHQFSVALQSFLCISKYFICPVQKLCSLLDNSSIHQVVSLEIETSYKQSLPIKVAAGEFYCFRARLDQPKTQCRIVVRNDAPICRSKVAANRRRSASSKDRLIFNRRSHLDWIACRRILIEHSRTKAGSKLFDEGHCVRRYEK